MLGRILFGLAVVAIGAVVGSVIVKTIRGIINRQKIRNLAHSEGMRRVVIDSIDSCTNKVKITDLGTNRQMSITGDGIDYDLYEGETITI